MPFASQAQRGLFYAAQADPAVRERTGISKSAADKMVSHDPGGRLPKRTQDTKKKAVDYGTMVAKANKY